MIQILAKGRFATQFGGRRVDVEDVPSEYSEEMPIISWPVTVQCLRLQSGKQLCH